MSFVYAMETLLRKYATTPSKWERPPRKLQDSFDVMGVRFSMTMTCLIMIQHEIFRVLYENFKYSGGLTIEDVEFVGDHLSMIAIEGSGVFDTAKIFISPEYIVTIVFSEKSVLIEY